MMTPEYDLLTIGPAAKYVSRSVDALRRWEAEGRLIPVGRGPRGERLYSRDQLDAIIGRASARQQPARRAERPAPSDDFQGGSEQLQVLWHRVRRYVLRVTTEPIPDDSSPDSLFFDPANPYRYIWTPEASDRCAEICERRARRYLFPGVTFGELYEVVNRTVEHFVVQDIDRRIREELLREGIDPDEG